MTSGTLLLIAILQVLTILVGLVRAKSLALLLGPGAFGIVSTIDQVVVTVLTLGALGMPLTALKFMARGHSEDEVAFERSGSGFLRLMTALGVITALIASSAAAWQPHLFGADLRAYQGALRVAVLGVPTAMLVMLFVNALAAARRPVAAALATLVVTAVLAFAAIAGALWHGIVGLYELSLGAAILLTVVGLVYLARALGIKLNTHHTGILTSLRSEPAIIGYSLCFYATFAGMSMMMLLARTMVLSRLGEVAVGHLQAAFSIALTVGAVLYPLSNLYLGPLVNSRGLVGAKARIADEYVSRMLLLLLVGAIPVLLFPAALVRLLFSSAFVPVASVLWLFVLWQCVFQIAYVYQLLLIGLDDVVFAASALIGGCLVAIGISAALTSRIGLAAVAIALATGMAIWGLAVIARLRLMHGVHVSRRVVQRLAIVILIVALTGYVFSGKPEIGVLPILVRFATGVSVAAIGWFLLDPQERNPRRWLAALGIRRNPDPRQLPHEGDRGEPQARMDAT